MGFDGYVFRSNGHWLSILLKLFGCELWSSVIDDEVRGAQIGVYPAQSECFPYVFGRSIFEEPSRPELCALIDDVEYIPVVKVYDIDVYNIVEGNGFIY